MYTVKFKINTPVYPLLGNVIGTFRFKFIIILFFFLVKNPQIIQFKLIVIFIETIGLHYVSH